MTNEEHHINQIIENTFKVLKNVYDNQKEGHDHTSKDILSRIIFPKYRVSGESRLSEQELRFIFVEQFNKYLDEYNKDKLETEKLNWFYSVETPTTKAYKFSEKGNKDFKPQQIDSGQSAMIDLSIHDANFNRIALIEFKAHNPKDACFTKDFLKLREEQLKDNEPLTYFIMYVESYDKDTIKRLNEKIEEPIYKTKTEKTEEIKYKSEHTKFYCYVLSNELEKWIISKDKKIEESDKMQ